MMKNYTLCFTFLLALLVSPLFSGNDFLMGHAYAAEAPETADTEAGEAEVEVEAGDTETGEPKKKKEGEEEPDC